MQNGSGDLSCELCPIVFAATEPHSSLDSEARKQAKYYSVQRCASFDFQRFKIGRRNHGKGYPTSRPEFHPDLKIMEPPWLGNVKPAEGLKIERPELGARAHKT